MCGIAGAFAFNLAAGPIDAAIVSRLNDLQRRRGPDGSGLWSSEDRRIVLGHRRLAIVDVGSSGAQPMSDATGRWTITFNGEIYNYRALRQDLENLGCVFATQSDTEVLINAVARWGEAGLAKLRGMFAFALWDSLERELWLVRDPYGIKPLYVAERSGTIWFASQARSLANCAPINANQDIAAVIGFHLWGHVPEPFTWWSGIRALPAGHLQRVRADRPILPPRCYQRIESAFTAAKPEPLGTGRLRRLLLDSVRHHLVSDVPVGVFLSAGIDSSVIAALGAELGSKLRTITLAFDEYAGTPNDEAPIAEETARLLGSDHITVRINRSEFDEVLDDFLSAMDQPTIDGLNMFLVSRAAAKQGLKVAISGLGGDELFGGYPSFRQIPTFLKWASWIPARRLLGSPLQRILRNIPEPIMRPKTAGLLAYSGNVCSAYFLRRALHLEDELDEEFDKSTLTDGLRRLATIPALAGTVEHLAASGVTKHAQISALESCWYMRNQLLRDTDWASMAHGLEVRVPYVDVTLLEHLAPAIASTTPPNKKDLANCARRLPESVLSRPKTGFTTPVRDWISQAQPSGLQGWAIDIRRRFCDLLVERRESVNAAAQAIPGALLPDHPAASTSPSIPNARAERVVVFRQGSIGDFVISLPCLHAIRQAYPHAKITLLTNQPTSRRTVPAVNILSGTNLVDDYLSYAGGTRNPWDLAKIKRALIKLNPTALVYLAHPRGAAATYRDYLFFRYCGIRTIVGLPLHDLQNCRPPAPGSTVWESEASRLARSLKLPQEFVGRPESWDLHFSRAEIETATQVLRSGFEDQYGNIPLLGLSIGTKQAINDWGLDNWMAVVTGLRNSGLGLVLLGAPEDREGSERLADLWQGPALNLCGKISPRLSAAVLQNISLFLCLDSGPMHLAAAVGTRCVAVFSKRNPPGQWFPFGSQHRIFYPSGADDTIQAIKPSDVIAAAREILGGSSRRIDQQRGVMARDEPDAQAVA